MKPPRGLSAEEAELWARLAATVKPLRPEKAFRPREGAQPQAGGGGSPPGATKPAKVPAAKPAPSPPQRVVVPPPRTPEDRAGLDSTWDRKLARGTLSPDFTLDLHGHTLDAAYRRLDQGVAQARALGARVVLVITGKPRPAEAADRGQKRGAIRAKVLDWLAAGQHASAIAAIRKAHRSHGGDGALYLVLRKER
jgi:DNA-nicking Smr family endonuclease